jgi:hypothetical protein
MCFQGDGGKLPSEPLRFSLKSLQSFGPREVAEVPGIQHEMPGKKRFLSIGRKLPMDEPQSADVLKKFIVAAGLEDRASKRRQVQTAVRRTEYFGCISPKLDGSDHVFTDAQTHHCVVFILK